jgi:hypothetical protein
MSVTVSVDMAKACAECGNAGASDNKLCVPCTTDSMDATRKMRSREGKLVQQRWARLRQEHQ